MNAKEKRASSKRSLKVASAAAATLLACALAFVIGPGGSSIDKGFADAYADEGFLPKASAPAAANEPEESEKESSAVSVAADDSKEPSGKASSDGPSDGFVSLGQIPSYTGSPYTELNGNKPYFDLDDYPSESFESYTPLDELGRCGECAALVGVETMPTEERGSIGQVKPSGWWMEKYDWVEGKYVYNRCHLLGYQLTAENANVRNLITGTRSMNVDAMEPFESDVADYVKSTGNHVLYRVTPLFEGKELVARGVVMEAYSVEDDGKGISFCIFCYNVEPGVTIDYATGENWADGTMGSGYAEEEASSSSGAAASAAAAAPVAQQGSNEYVLNTNSKKFHHAWCGSVDQMSDSNKKFSNGTRDSIVSQGYDPCKRCNP